MMDEIADFADRCRSMSEFEFTIEWYSLTPDERDQFLALLDQRTAQSRERLEAIQEDIRILKLLFAHKQGVLTAQQFAERVRGAVPEGLGR